MRLAYSSNTAVPRISGTGSPPTLHRTHGQEFALAGVGDWLWQLQLKVGAGGIEDRRSHRQCAFAIVALIDREAEASRVIEVELKSAVYFAAHRFDPAAEFVVGDDTRTGDAAPVCVDARPEIEPPRCKVISSGVPIATGSSDWRK